MTRRTRACLLGMLAAAVAGCGGAEAGVTALADDVGAVSPDPTVAVVDNAFEDDEIVVEAGTEVAWEWRGDSEHDVVGPGFDSDLQATGTFAHTFDEPGTYTYVCTPHGGMTGTVHVVPGS